MAFAPVMRTDEHHVEMHERILKMKERRIEVVFLGDSLTRRWEDYEEVWDKYFARYHPANFGVGADCIQNVKWRVLNQELDGIAPRLLILLIGTNNLPTNTVEEIVSGIEDLVGIIRRKLPDTRLLLLGLLPRNPDDQGIDYNSKITEINQELKIYCAEHQVRFAEISGVLPQTDGKVDTNIMPDGLHLNEKGYELIGPELVRYIEELW